MGLSDLSPNHVINSVNILCNSLSIFPGRDERKLGNDKFFKEANNYATELIKIYLHQELSAKRLIINERFSR
jgi:hypothetical protein